MIKKAQELIQARSKVPTILIIFVVLLLFFDIGIREIFTPTRYQVIPNGDVLTGSTFINLASHRWWGYGNSVYEPIRYRADVSGDSWEVYRSGEWQILDIQSKSRLMRAFDAYSYY